MGAMPRYKLIVAYDGTGFHGWQKQHPPDHPPLRTVQGVLEQAVAETLTEPVSVLGASRTDAGVHARAQVAAFSTTARHKIATERLAGAINARLPDDVRVRRVTIADAGFSPISDAIAKGYRYRIAHTCGHGAARPLFDRHITYWTPYRLDPDRMNEAARRLIGRHDFTSFTRVHHNRQSTVRTIHDCSVTTTGPRRCRLDVSGDGFLYNMVRIIAGTLANVGLGKTEPEAVADILAATDRRAAGPTLPPEGLFLMWVKYRSHEP